MAIFNNVLFVAKKRRRQQFLQSDAASSANKVPESVDGRRRGGQQESLCHGIFSLIRDSES